MYCTYMIECISYLYNQYIIYINYTYIYRIIYIYNQYVDHVPKLYKYVCHQGIQGPIQLHHIEYLFTLD